MKLPVWDALDKSGTNHVELADRLLLIASDKPVADVLLNAAGWLSRRLQNRALIRLATGRFRTGINLYRGHCAAFDAALEFVLTDERHASQEVLVGRLQDLSAALLQGRGAMHEDAYMVKVTAHALAVVTQAPTEASVRSLAA